MIYHLLVLTSCTVYFKIENGADQLGVSLNYFNWVKSIDEEQVQCTYSCNDNTTTCILP